MIGKDLFEIYDFFLVPIYLILILFIANRIKSKNIINYPEYKYFTYGLVVKLIGVSFFMVFYTVVNKTGDTVSYFLGTKAISELIFKNFEAGLSVLFNIDNGFNNYNSFSITETKPPYYIMRDENTFNVCRISFPLYIISSGSFIITSFLTSVFSYIGLWKLYRLFNSEFPGNSKIFAYLILFLPSTVFWGSGIMKDSFVLGACCFAVSNFFKIFIKREKVLINIILIVINFSIVINVKSFVAVSMIPGLIIWANNSFLVSIKSNFIKFITFPIILFIILGSGYVIFNNLSALGLGQYENVDQTFEQAQIIQQDLLRSEQYGTNNYSIGTLDGTLSNSLKLAPLAIFTAIYRPSILEIGSPAMVISVIENLFLLLFSIYALSKTNPLRLLKQIFSSPILTYSLIFTVLFGFGVGIASTNFGALVRYRIPLIPFYFPLIYLISKKKINP